MPHLLPAVDEVIDVRFLLGVQRSLAQQVIRAEVGEVFAEAELLPLGAKASLRAKQLRATSTDPVIGRIGRFP